MELYFLFDFFLFSLFFILLFKRFSFKNSVILESIYHPDPFRSQLLCISLLYFVAWHIICAYRLHVILCFCNTFLAVLKFIVWASALPIFVISNIKIDSNRLEFDFSLDSPLSCLFTFCFTCAALFRCVWISWVISYFKIGAEREREYRCFCSWNLEIVKVSVKMLYYDDFFCSLCSDCCVRFGFFTYLDFRILVSCVDCVLENFLFIR